MCRYLLSLFILVTTCSVPGQDAASLPNSIYLTWPEEDLTKRITEGLERFIDQQIDDAILNRTQKWQRDPLISDQEHSQIVSQKREQFRNALGVVDPLLPSKLEFFANESSIDGDIPNAKVSESDSFEIYQVRWPVIDGFSMEGLYAIPKKPTSTPSVAAILPKKFAMVLIPDVGETPEDLLGLTANLLPEQQIGVRWASAGFSLLIPTTIDRKQYRDQLSAREYLHQKAYKLGRQVVSYEIQAALSAANWLKSEGHQVSIGGYGEGGRLAFYAAACQPGFETVFVSGFFNNQTKPWQQPIDQTIWAELRDYGHAEIATLIYPSTIFVEQTKPNSKEATEKEISRAGALTGETGLPRWLLNSEERFGARAGYPAVAALTNEIGFTDANVSRLPPVAFISDKRTQFSASERQNRLVTQMINCIDNLHADAETSRTKQFQIDSNGGNNQITDKAIQLREKLHQQVVGQLNLPMFELECRSRKIYQENKFTAWDVVLPLFFDCFHWGVLIQPASVTENQKKSPIVVIQSEAYNLPIDWSDRETESLEQTARDLVTNGYVVYISNAVYQNNEANRTLERKCHAIGYSLGSISIASHQQLLKWIKTLPYIDPSKITYYGLNENSFAMRTPALLTDYQSIICVDCLATNQEQSISLDWNLIPRFQTPEIASLLSPRPLFIREKPASTPAIAAKRAAQFARIKWWYEQFDFRGQMEIELLDGKSEQPTQFLDKNLGDR